MEITDIIGKDCAFVPPFSTDEEGKFIYDFNGQIMIEIEPNWWYLYNLFGKSKAKDIHKVIADYIVELLNKDLA